MSGYIGPKSADVPVGTISTVGTVSANSLVVGTNNVTIGNAVYVASNGNVGIGTSAPASTLEIGNGFVVISGTPNYTNNFITQTGAPSAVNASISIHTNSTLTSNSTTTSFYNILATPKLNSNGVGSLVAGVWSVPRIHSSVATESVTSYGVLGLAYRNSNNDVTTGTVNLYGGIFQTGHNNASNTSQSYTSSSSYGVVATSVNQNGSISNMYGSSYNVAIATNANRTANATTAYGFYTTATVGATSGTGTGTLTNYYDAYLGGVTVNSTGTVTNKYGIYQVKTDHINYFGGKVGIGTSTPSYKLHVNTGASGGFALFEGSSRKLFLEDSGDSVRLSTEGTGPLTLRAAGSGGNHLVIDSSGRVTMPNQPSFLSSGGGQGTLTTNTNTVLSLNYSVTNVGSHYNTSTSAFTAPIAGLYKFYFQIYTQNGANVKSIAWRKNGSEISFGGDTAISFQGGTNISDVTISGSVILSLAANDYIQIGVRNLGSANLTWYAGHSWWYGYLIG